MKPTGKSTTRTGRARRTALALFAMLLLMPITAWGQSLTPDDPGAAQQGRTPLVLIHGLCAGRETWSHEAGLARFLRSRPDFGDSFALYHFEYPISGSGAGDLTALCGDGVHALTPDRVRALAASLLDALDAEPGIGPDREIAIVAHSAGGLVMRSFLQEFGQAERTQVAITLATPHHGAPWAKEVDAVAGQPNQHAAMYSDGYDGGDPEDNPWLRCLNGLAPAGAGCEDGDGAHRAAALARIVAIGLVLPESLADPRPDDGLVPIESALLDGSAIRGRYAGLGGQQGGSLCWGDASAHHAILHEDCRVADVSGGAETGIFDVIAQELGLSGAEAEQAQRKSQQELDLFPPDLIVTVASPAPMLMTPGQTISITVTTKNIGIGTAGSSMTRFYLSVNQTKGTGDKRLAGVQSVPSLGSDDIRNNTIQATVPATMASGPYYLLACADDKKTVPEAIESNNCKASGPVTVARPDLVVTAVIDPPQSVAPGGTFGVSDTTRNQGTVPSGPTKTRYYLSVNAFKNPDSRLLNGVRSVPGLNADQPSASGRLVTVPAGTPSAQYYLLACADDQGDVKESVETNNCRASVTKVFVGKPDLQVTLITNPPSPVVSPGSEVVLSEVVVSNVTAAPSPGITVRFYLSEDTVKSSGDRLMTGDVFMPDFLPFGQHSNIFGPNPVVPQNTPLGTYYVIACADATNDVAETNETNNCRATTATISVTRPDLVVTDVSTPATAAAPGTLIEVTDTTANQGLVPAPASTTRYYLSTDTVKSTGDKQLTGSRPVQLLDAGGTSSATLNVTIPVNTTPGVYWLLACADSSNVVPELSETNNCKATTAQITIAP